MRLLLLTLTLVGTRLEAVVVVETSLRAPRTVVVALASVPFAAVALSEGEGGVEVSLRKPGRTGRQHVLDSGNKPLLKFDQKSPETVKIAEKISALFASGAVGGAPGRSGVGPAINSVNMTVGGGTSNLNRPMASATSTPFQLSVNLNVELEHGKPSRVRLPQGELTLMYLPQIRQPGGGGAVELSHAHLRNILAETSHPSSMVMLPNGGLLLMSLAPYHDTQGVARPAPLESGAPAMQEPAILRQDLNTVNLQHQQEMVMRRPTARLKTTSTSTAKPTTPSPATFTYPAAWKNKIPKFPYVPMPEQEKEVEDLVPVSTSLPLTTPSPFTRPLWETTFQPATYTTLRQASTTTKSPLFNNHIEVHHPLLKQEQGAVHAPSSFLLPVGASSSSPPKKKRYRQEQQTTLGFDNVNVVIPGRFNLTPRPDGVTQCKRDSSTNGTRVCTTRLANNCQGGFKLGGNCNGQQAQEGSRGPQAAQQMGEEQSGGNLGTRFVPPGPQQTNMAMMALPRPPPSPLQVTFNRDTYTTDFLATPSTTSTSRPTRPATTRPTSTLSPRQAMVEHVMHMEPPELVDALMEPMMMAVGGMVAMAGAYMAIAIDELAASNALALAGGFGGRRRRRK